MGFQGCLADAREPRQTVRGCCHVWLAGVAWAVHLLLKGVRSSATVHKKVMGDGRRTPKAYGSRPSASAIASGMGGKGRRSSTGWWHVRNARRSGLQCDRGCEDECGRAVPQNHLRLRESTTSRVRRGDLPSAVRRVGRQAREFAPGGRRRMVRGGGPTVLDRRRARSRRYR